MKAVKKSAVREMLASIPVICAQTAFILAFELAMFVLTMAGGIFSGHLIVQKIYYYFGHPGVVQGPIRMFKEVMWGAVMTITLVLIVVIPVEKYIFRPVVEQLFKKIRAGTEMLLAILDAYLLGVCFAHISILFEVRYCKKDFEFLYLSGPVRAFFYLLNESPAKLSLGYIDDTEGFEETLSFPLFLAFGYPIYSFIRCYFNVKSSKFSVSSFLEKFLPHPCCCDSEEEDEKYKVDWTAQAYGLMLEAAHILALYIPLMATIKIACTFAGTWRPGFLFVGFGSMGFFASFALVVVESANCKIFKRAQNGVESRIFLNLCLLTFFVTKNFLVFFEPLDSKETCSSGFMEMNATVSQAFAAYFTFGIYAAWKIMFLSISFHKNGIWDKETKLKAAFAEYAADRSEIGRRFTMPSYIYRIDPSKPRDFAELLKSTRLNRQAMTHAVAPRTVKTEEKENSEKTESQLPAIIALRV